MIIFIDTNILISAALNPNSTPFHAYVKANTLPNRAVISEQVIAEMHRIFEKKFPMKLPALEIFIKQLREHMTIIGNELSYDAKEELIRDRNDRPLLRAAIKANADIILTGDKDFLEAELDKPLPMTASDFLLLGTYEKSATSFFINEPIHPYGIMFP